VTSRKIDPTKKNNTRKITELVALTTARCGSADSAAAMVAISAPTMEKTTITIPEKIAPTPCGMNPPWAVRLEKSRWRPGHRPSTKSAPSPMKTMIVATLIPANQYSNSP
jgi:hypothetical protein